MLTIFYQLCEMMMVILSSLIMIRSYHNAILLTTAKSKKKNIKNNAMKVNMEFDRLSEVRRHQSQFPHKTYGYQTGKKLVHYHPI